MPCCPQCTSEYSDGFRTCADCCEAPHRPWWKQKQYIFWIVVSVALIVGFVILGISFAPHG